MKKFIKYMSGITIFLLSLTSCNEKTTSSIVTSDPTTTSSEVINYHKASGNLGDYHSYDLENGILTIENTDDLSYRINYNSQDMPWEEYKDEITRVDFIGRVETLPYMFDYYKNLKTVNADGGLYYIQHHTFLNCSNLEILTGVEHLYYIGSHAFENCVSLKTLPVLNFLSEIDEYAFSGCTSLDNIIMPSTVMRIGNHAFSDCTSIKALSLNEGIEEIEEYAFNGCISLKEIYFPKTVLVTTKVFSECKELECIYLNSLEGVTYFFENSRDINDSLLINIKKDIDYIPEGYSEISSNVFAYKCYAKDVK